ncbi:glycosyl hydrolase [Chryseobacterium lactis]|uniref:Glycosyl hydrolase n=1 Tax=Chryseobacterium lactis TaxID=1241981 RepID=A0A3G6RMX6_CHRLC|nr:glycosyl hydrolase [Chryseobacterium lactis]AZA83061.1 glycosyl hydrolase [Chryseobacterium lactis]AZB03444.1 glycosyl hydrolase [Chryseobacterium lactis]PNW12052.1 glycosyl hydrolase [Chryseobacterium lactis]
MKKIFSITFMLAGICVFSQQVESFETVLNDKISVRALELHDNKVWYSGTDSKFGFIDLKDSKNQKQIKLSETKLQFRTLGQDKTSFYAINIESPAKFFKIDKKDLKSQVVFTDTTKTAFYDALHFVNDKLAYTFSDADKDNLLKLAVYKNGKWGMFKNNIALNPGEAAFAASNTNISSTKNYMWIATGGKASRIVRLNFKNEKFEVFETPFIQGESSQGMYSVDFSDDQFGIAVGGDYTKQEANINNIATTHDGGQTWQIQASENNAGYMTCVKIKPGSKGKEIIAVGDRHISYSADFGKTWKKISDEKGLFVCQWIDYNRLVFAGNNRVMIMKLKF